MRNVPFRKTDGWPAAGWCAGAFPEGAADRLATAHGTRPFLEGLVAAAAGVVRAGGLRLPGRGGGLVGSWERESPLPGRLGFPFQEGPAPPSGKANARAIQQQ